MNSARRAYLISGRGCKLRGDRPAFRSWNCERSSSNKIWPLNSWQNSGSPLNHAKDKINELIERYQQFTGLEELNHAHARAEEAGHKLNIMQEERRNAFTELLEIQNKLKGIYSQLENTRRGEDRYIKLITEEHSLLKQEETQQEKFKNVERAERDQFTLFTHLVRSVHEKERARSERTKYLSIIGSILGTVIGVIGSSITTYRKRMELKKLIAESSNSNLESQLNKFLKNQNVTGSKFQWGHDVWSELWHGLRGKSTDFDTGKMHKCLNDLLHLTNNILLSVQESIKLIKPVSESAICYADFNSEIGKNVLIINSQSLKQYIHNQSQNVQSYILKCSVLIIFCIVLSKLSW